MKKFKKLLLIIVGILVVIWCVNYFIIDLVSYPITLFACDGKDLYVYDPVLKSLDPNDDGGSRYVTLKSNYEYDQIIERAKLHGYQVKDDRQYQNNLFIIAPNLRVNIGKAPDNYWYEGHPYYKKWSLSIHYDHCHSPNFFVTRQIKQVLKNLGIEHDTVTNSNLRPNSTATLIPFM